MNTHSIHFRLILWYSALLSLLMVAFSVAVYFGLERYLTWNLRDRMFQSASEIAPLLGDSNTNQPMNIAAEINAHYAPETSNLFLRITRGDGRVLYVSGVPRDASFDPDQIPAAGYADHKFSRQESLAAFPPVLISAVPFAARDGTHYLVEAGASVRPIEDTVRGLLWGLGALLPLMVSVAMCGGYALTRRALMPVDEITKKAERITSNNLIERLPTPATGDEIERLSIALNRMIERLEKSFHHINRFSADASHELRTPLTILRGELEALTRQKELPPDVQRTIVSSLEEIERLTRITESLLVVSKLEAGNAAAEFQTVDVAELVRATVPQMQLLAQDKNIGLTLSTPERLVLRGDEMRLKQVVVNLLDNAIKYTPVGGKVGILVEQVNGHVVVEVKDNGPGISPTALSHIFERFYRADEARARKSGGTGLGLSIVKSICHAHGGEVSVTSEQGKGSTFRVELPSDFASRTTNNETIPGYESNQG